MYKHEVECMSDPRIILWESRGCTWHQITRAISRIDKIICKQLCDMQVSWWNRGTPTNHPFIDGFFLINHPFLGIPIYGNPHMQEHVLFFFGVFWTHDGTCLNILKMTIFFGYPHPMFELFDGFDNGHNIRISPQNRCFVHGIHVYLHMYIYIYIYVYNYNYIYNHM